MRYSIEPRDRIYLKGYGFLSFAKNMVKSLSNKHGQNLLDSAKKPATDAIKTASKIAIQKTEEASSHFIGNRIADKITNLEKSAKYLQNNETEENVERATHKKKYISLQKKDNKLLTH